MPNATNTTVANAANSEANHIESESGSQNVTELESTIALIDGLSHEGFSEIETLAEMALIYMETEWAYLWPEHIARLLISIRSKAQDIKNIINCEAERLGFDCKDEAAARRSAAKRSAELRGRVAI